MYTLKPINIKHLDPDLSFEKIVDGENRTFFIAEYTLYLNYHSDPDTFVQFDGIQARDVILSRDGELMAVLDIDSIVIFKDRLALFSISIPFHYKKISMAFSPNNRQLICAHEGEPRLLMYNLCSPNFAAIQILSPTQYCRLTEPVLTIGFSGDHHLFAITKTNRVLAIAWESSSAVQRFIEETLYQRPSTKTSRIQAAAIFHVLNVTIYALTTGQVICFASDNHQNFAIIERVWPFDYIKLMPSDARATILLFANLKHEYATLWMFVIKPGQPIGTKILSSFYPLTTRFSELKDFVGSFSAKIATAATTVINTATCVFKKPEGKFYPPFTELEKINFYDTEADIHYQQRFVYVLECIKANFRVLNCHSPAIMDALQHYTLSEPFNLRQIYIHKLQLHLSVMRAGVFLIDSEKESIVDILKNYHVSFSPWSLNVIYAEFSLFEVSYQINAYLADSTHIALTKVNPKIVRKYNLLLPTVINRERQHSVDLSDSSTLLWP